MAYAVLCRHIGHVSTPDFTPQKPPHYGAQNRTIPPIAHSCGAQASRCVSDAKYYIPALKKASNWLDYLIHLEASFNDWSVSND
jgi:hypothetical protein